MSTSPTHNFFVAAVQVNHPTFDGELIEKMLVHLSNTNVELYSAFHDECLRVRTARHGAIADVELSYRYESGDFVREILHKSLKSVMPRVIAELTTDESLRLTRMGCDEETILELPNEMNHARVTMTLRAIDTVIGSARFVKCLE